ncbi:MAG: hypothetical protein JRJ69_02085 [Deltaproteobacteria bacterium]|nr:hypothetical protein [Deltaproteobacteria bacterium]
MSRTLFLIFNHEITPVQRDDAERSLGVEQLEDMPTPLKELWQDIPPELREIDPYLEPVKAWLEAKAKTGDYVLVQGDFGACYLMVRFCFEKALVPVYSTTSREAEEGHLQDGAISLNHVFRHRIFRRYGA